MVDAPAPMLAALFDGDPDAGGVELAGTRRAIHLIQVGPDAPVTVRDAVSLRWQPPLRPPSHAAILSPAGTPLFYWPVPHPGTPRARGGVSLPAGLALPAPVAPVEAETKAAAAAAD